MGNTFEFALTIFTLFFVNLQFINGQGKWKTLLLYIDRSLIQKFRRQHMFPLQYHYSSDWRGKLLTKTLRVSEGYAL